MAIFNITNNKGEKTGLTPFLTGVNFGDRCQNFNGSPYDITLYHNGQGQFPVLGDMVFVDFEGFIPYNPPADIQLINEDYITLNENGLVIQIDCR